MDTDFEKYTWEVFPIECDFEDVLATNETITLASSSVTIYDADGADKTSTMLVADSETVSGTKFQAKVQAGTIDAKYVAMFKIVTNADNKYQGERTFYIKYETS